MAPKDDLRDTLLREGVVTADLLNEILREHDRGNDSLLEILLRSGRFDEKKLVHVFSRYYGCTAVNLTVFVIEKELIE